MSGSAGTGGIEYQQWPPQCGGLLPCTYWPQDAVAFTHLTVSAIEQYKGKPVVAPAIWFMCHVLRTNHHMLLQRHAAVMGPTWGILIPATILMARLRHKEGLWFKLHQALAVLSLVLVVLGAWLGRRLSQSHQTHARAAGIHSVLGYTTSSFMVAQVGNAGL